MPELGPIGPKYRTQPHTPPHLLNTSEPSTSTAANQATTPQIFAKILGCKISPKMGPKINIFYMHAAYHHTRLCRHKGVWGSLT